LCANAGKHGLVSTAQVPLALGAGKRTGALTAAIPCCFLAPPAGCRQAAGAAGGLAPNLTKPS